MELPQTVHPSRLSPHFVWTYLAWLLVGVALAAAVTVVRPRVASVLPATPLVLYAVLLIPLYKLLRTEMNRGHREYEFQQDRVLVREGGRTVEQEDIPYEKITDVASVTPPFESLVDVGDLELHMTGTDKAVEIIGIKHPQRYEDLMLGRTDTGGTTLKAVEQELADLEAAYSDGDIGRAEYEQRYYYLQGQRDLLREQQGE